MSKFIRIKERPLQKQFARILRTAGCSDVMVDTVFEAAVKHRGPQPMTMKDVWGGNEDDVERRGGEGDAAGVAGVGEVGVAARAIGGVATAFSGVDSPDGIDAEIGAALQSKGYCKESPYRVIINPYSPYDLKTSSTLTGDGEYLIVCEPL